MKAVRIWGGLVALGALLAPGAAEAQQLFSTPNVFMRSADAPDTTPGGAPRWRRVRFGVGGTIWDSVPGVAPGPLLGLGTLVPEPSPSPIFSLDYAVTKRISVGGWWNPQSSDLEFRKNAAFPFPAPSKFNIGTLRSNQWNLRGTINLEGLGPRIITDGLSLEGGYAATSHDVDFRRTAANGGVVLIGFTNVGFTQKSGNVWLNKSIRVGSFRGEGRRLPITLFGSGGYYFDDFGDDGGGAWQALGGLSLGLSDSITVGASYWLFDVGGADNSRISAGLTWSL